jgi:hypothetical protein
MVAAGPAVQSCVILSPRCWTSKDTIKTSMSSGAYSRFLLLHRVKEWHGVREILVPMRLNK